MRAILLLLFLPIICIQSEQHVDLFSSISELEKLFVKEQLLSNKLKTLAANLENKRTILSSVLQQGCKDNENVDCSSHINTLNATTETTIETPTLINKALNKTLNEIKILLESTPKAQDIQGAANGIFLLQETYDLNITKFSSGDVAVSPAKTELQSEDIEFIGKVAYNRGYYDRATEWFDVAIEKAKKENRIKSEIKDLEKTLRVMKTKHDKVLEAKGPFSDIWRTYLVPFNPELRKAKKYKKIKDKRYKHEHILFETMLVGRSETFNALCRGEKLRPAEYDKDLKCIFLHSHDPYLKLGPFKLEQHSLQPFIGIFHDFMYDSETSHYINYAQDKLVRSLLRETKKIHEGKLSVRRTSSHAWLHERDKKDAMVVDDEVSDKVAKRISMATGMNALMDMGGEPFLITNYGIGGVYDFHTDGVGEAKLMTPEAEDILDKEGARLATAMTYMSEVEAGGATVFPNVGVSLWPKKGDMAFWYNNDYNGKLDGLTVHGGCPVLAGSKWITNKWLRSFGQFGKFSCVTEPPSELRRIKPLSN